MAADLLPLPEPRAPHWSTGVEDMTLAELVHLRRSLIAELSTRWSWLKDQGYNPDHCPVVSTIAAEIRDVKERIAHARRP